MKIYISTKELKKLSGLRMIQPSNNIKDGYVITLTNGIEQYKAEVTLNRLTKEEEQLELELVNNQNTKTVEEWIDDWRSKWRVKSGYMGNRQDCIDKMVSFFEEHPEINKDLVYRARNKYFTQLNENYEYLEKANNFISKRVPDKEHGGYKYRKSLEIHCEEVIALDKLGANDENTEDLLYTTV